MREYGNLRLKFCDPAHMEARDFAQISHSVKEQISRKHFEDVLNLRKTNHHKWVVECLINLEELADWESITSGDWHCRQRSEVLSSVEKTLVVKPRNVLADLLVWELLLKRRESGGLKIAVPTIELHSNFSLQEFISGTDLKGDSSEVLGQLLAVALFFGMADLHHENIIISQDICYLIDCDCIANFTTEKTIQAKLNATGVVFPIGFQEKSGISHFSSYEISKLFDVFEKELRILMKNYGTELENKIDRIPVRVLFGTTDTYSKLLRRRYLLGQNENEFRDSLFRVLSSKSKPNSALESEIEALCRWDIPFFFRKEDMVFSLCRDDVPIMRTQKSSSIVSEAHVLFDSLNSDDLRKALEIYLEKAQVE